MIATIVDSDQHPDLGPGVVSGRSEQMHHETTVWTWSVDVVLNISTRLDNDDHGSLGINRGADTTLTPPVLILMVERMLLMILAD